MLLVRLLPQKTVSTPEDLMKGFIAAFKGGISDKIRVSAGPALPSSCHTVVSLNLDELLWSL